MSSHSNWYRFRRNCEHVARGLLLLVLRLALKRRTAAQAKEEFHFSNIIIVRTSHNLGDVIMTSAVVEECSQLFPQAKLTLLVHARIAELFRHNPAIDEMLLFDPRWFLHPISTARLLKRLRGAHNDLAIACSNAGAPSLNDWLLTRLTNAARRVGFAEKEADTFLNVVVEPQPDSHFISNQLRLLSPFAAPSAFRLPRVVVTDEEIADARALLEAGTINETSEVRPVVVFVPEPRRKCWPLTPFLELADILCHDGFPVLLVFGPRDPRRADSTVLALASRWKDRLRVLPPMQLRPLAAVMSQCRLFISNDCGPMHLAVAVGTPTVAVFLFGNKHVHGYENDVNHIVVQGNSDELRLQEIIGSARRLLLQQTPAP
jgi:ADP-heptose:LPS heptosyltransferase